MNVQLPSYIDDCYYDYDWSCALKWATDRNILCYLVVLFMIDLDLCVSLINTNNNWYCRFCKFPLANGFHRYFWIECIICQCITNWSQSIWWAWMMLSMRCIQFGATSIWCKKSCKRRQNLWVEKNVMKVLKNSKKTLKEDKK